VGFPIRRFTDQSLFAAPHDLSQRTTSFIASQRQGIHQIPLRHLIALIAKARFHPRRFGNRQGPTLFSIEKTSFASNASGNPSGQALGSTTGCSKGKMSTKRLAQNEPHGSPRGASPHPALDRMRFLFTMSDIGRPLAFQRRKAFLDIIARAHAPAMTNR
jgi:hypothetical protein